MQLIAADCQLNLLFAFLFRTLSCQQFRTIRKSDLINLYNKANLQLPYSYILVEQILATNGEEESRFLAWW